MPLSLYDATVPAFLQILPSISGLLDKGAAWCRERGVADTALTEARLAPDMWPFASQVRSCWAHSADAVDAVKSGEARPDFSEPPRDFAGLKARVEDAIARLKAVTPDELEAVESGDTYFQIGERRMDFRSVDYLLTFALPNFYFHATTAYAILRNQGLEIGKRDFLGGIKLKG
ncbi:MAG: DUF1993 domain-containing protein [Novosphingobium sp.]|nr:DUF1993 domain-containing protein [Novosphingobium sp.]